MVGEVDPSLLDFVRQKWELLCSVLRKKKYPSNYLKEDSHFMEEKFIMG